MLSRLAPITPAIIKEIASEEIAGVYTTEASAILGNIVLTIRPKAMGRITIWIMLQNMLTGSKAILSPMIR